jgi:ferric-dicitrate binding protein FerR (iron transport regulator)
MSEIDIIIQKYLQGRTSEEENLQLHQWTQLSPENKKRLFAEKDIWDTIDYHTNRKGYEAGAEFEILRRSLDNTKSVRTIRPMTILKIAAVFLISFGLGWVSQYIPFNNKQSSTEVTLQEIFVPKGQVNQVFLADGTRIWINSETRISLPSVFASNERSVNLDGEAFFEVAKDEKRPFRVNVNGQQIEVLGTSFNVRAYTNSKIIETTLTTGRIQLQTGSQTTILEPGEQSTFNKENKSIVISKVDPGPFNAWKDGRFEFHDEYLLEVFKVVERWYDVEIIINEAYFSGMHFSGVIKRSKDAKHFLELLNHTIPINYEIKDDRILITPQ